MSSLGRSRRGHLSKKVANVKLRPAGPIDRHDHNTGRPSKLLHGKDDVNLMDRTTALRQHDQHAHDDTESMESDRPEDTLPFAGHLLCFTGITDERVDLQSKVIKMGARNVLPDLTLDVTALISRGYDSLKYVRAVEYRIPVYTPSWITHTHALWLEGADTDAVSMEERYRLKAFTGLKIAVTGIETGKRSSMISLIRKHGGLYSPELDRSCTHLIVSNPKIDALASPHSAKVAWAIQSNKNQKSEQGSAIRIVWEGWLWDCVGFNGRFKEEQWDVETLAAPPSESESFASKELRRNADRARAQERLDAMRRETEAAQRAQPVDLPDTGRSDESHGGVTIDVADTMQTAANQKQAQTPLNTRTATHSMGIIEDMIASVRQPNADTPDGTEVDDHQPAKRIRTATDAPQARPSGTRVSTTQTGGLPRRSLSILDRRSAFNLPSGTKSPTLPVQPKAAPFGGSDGDRPGRCNTARTAEAGSMETTTEGGLFKGLTFSHNISGPIGTFEAAVRGNGGTLVTYESWSKGTEVDYFVCRLAGSNPPDLSDRRPTEVVTDCWLERCLTERRICNIEDSVVFRPLQCETPLPDADRLAIHLSGYNEEQSYYLKRLIKAIGGQVENGLSKARTTHLVSARDRGVKVVRAEECHIPVVTAAWLYDMAKSGSISSVESFRIQPSVLDASQNFESRGALSSSNLSTISDGGNPFGLDPPKPKLSDRGSGMSRFSGDTRENGDDRAVNNRLLGLAPTAINEQAFAMDNVVIVDTATTEQGDRRSTRSEPESGFRQQHLPESIRVDHSHSDSHIGDRVMSAAGSPRRSRLSGRQSPQGAVSGGPPVISSDVWAGLHRDLVRSAPGAALSEQKRRERVARGKTTTPNPFFNNPSNHLAADTGIEIHDTEDAGDESMRIIYVDPAAEREKNKLLGIGRDKRKRS